MKVRSATSWSRVSQPLDGFNTPQRRHGDNNPIYICRRPDGLTASAESAVDPVARLFDCERDQRSASILLELHEIPFSEIASSVVGIHGMLHDLLPARESY